MKRQELCYCGRLILKNQPKNLNQIKICEQCSNHCTKLQLLLLLGDEKQNLTLRLKKIEEKKEKFIPFCQAIPIQGKPIYFFFEDDFGLNEMQTSEILYFLPTDLVMLIREYHLEEFKLTVDYKMKIEDWLGTLHIRPYLTFSGLDHQLQFAEKDSFLPSWIYFTFTEDHDSETCLTLISNHWPPKQSDWKKRVCSHTKLLDCIDMLIECLPQDTWNSSEQSLIF